jgi:hypothetical protein
MGDERGRTGTWSQLVRDGEITDAGVAALPRRVHHHLVR